MNKMTELEVWVQAYTAALTGTADSDRITPNLSKSAKDLADQAVRDFRETAYDRDGEEVGSGLTGVSD